MRKQVYPNWRLDKNISWHNFFTWPSGIIFGIITLEWIREPKVFRSRLKPWKIWIPPHWAEEQEKE